MADAGSAPPAITAHAVELTLEAVPENAMLIRQAIAGGATALGASEEVIEDVKLAVTEGSSNAIKYAYKQSPGTLRVALDPLADGFAVTISDSGRWSEPEIAEQPGGGLGLPLMGALAREFLISTGATGTTVRLEFGLERAQNNSEADAENSE